MKKSETLPEKRCATCGRNFEWRRRWARDWESVRYCGERCRRAKPNQVDHDLEAAILDLLGRRSAGASLCPSEAARVVGGDDWRPLMERARWAANRLVGCGQLEVLQNGKRVEAESARGPIRLRRVGRMKRRGPDHRA